jgi:hypothetical protein
MSGAFEAVTVNGIEVEIWEKARPGAMADARRLAGHLPRGGEFGQGSVKGIHGPTMAGGTMEVWLDGDGFARFEIPDGYEVKSVSAFETAGACITLKRVE